MKSVAWCFVVLFTTMFCMSVIELSAMQKTKRDRFAATKAVFGMACEYVQEIPTHALEGLNARFPHLTKKQLIIGLVAVCLVIGAEELMRMCVMNNGDWFWFLNVTNVKDIFFGVSNHT